MIDRPRRSLGERLRRERESRHWTQEYLAEQIGASVPSINRWENDRVTTPRGDMLNALIKLFGKPVEAWGEGRQVLWNLPFLRNLYFTGRERVLAQLHHALTGYNIVAVTQTRVMSGLGGIGKTQIAVEYAYRFAQEYDVVLWVRADSREVLVSNMAALAGLLGLPIQDETDQPRLAKAVKRWLETQDQQTWLLIFDNADDLSLVIEFLPTRGNGAILLTTRSHVVGKHIRRIELDKLTLEEGVPFLLRRAAGLEQLALEDVPAPERQAAAQLYGLMDGLPLALDQAAAYIQEHQWSLAEYISLYQQQRPALLRLRNSIDQHDYPDSVATTWLLSFQRVEQAHPAAAELLRLCAFLHPDAIPEEMLLQRVAELHPHVQAEKQSALLKEIIVIWLRYSLVQHNAVTRTLTIHRLVQAVLQDTLEESQQRAWAERAIHVVNNTFPGASAAFSTWPRCQRCLPHALVCAALVERWSVQSEEAAQLLQRTGTYLRERGDYGEAEMLLQHALHIRENIVGPEHPSLADYFEALAELYQKLAQYAQGESLPSATQL
jgi:transcriptional regulator with XRE-family HTH domain